ncbi:dolichyl-diphosphooligosaccharide-protein glycotransferase [Cavenderia fasciculata]|uniref:Dolichyl-diphosphooligosaccharide--protein glycosyltransferase 48 kDa subunit n=1 Tax=Cavenderia fasciculata TaxID=261658 RepID=F4Q4G9_CACFS|nr:dolichyl-diphosphooligosaccharide-protein glycotransferase [Cavenderia fasciculata]EGG17818.1 dolichyl-diphosphooligosaccharide-protein glycotransferase [Cavenderia fasciculata]|eukprot:XP_004356302.1 dolichyl-diphosphooligosaccharide-protein glycotransferase [Cavenderia fasciculata]
MYRNILICLVVALFAIVAVSASSATVGGKKTLVLINNQNIKQTHSKFFKYLDGKGYQLEYKRVDDETIKLQKYGDFNYDNLIILTNSNSDELSLTGGDLVEFVDSGRNVFIATTNQVSESIRDVASECGIEIQDDNTIVYDHFNFDKSESTHNLIVADQFIKDSPIILQGADKNPVLFKGIGHQLRDNPLNFAVLSTAYTAYSGKLNGQSTKLQGKIGLVSSLQARNNARFTYSGSLDLLSNKFYEAKINSDSPSGNQQFVENLISWTFQDRGILRTSNRVITKGNETNPFQYTIKDVITYSIKVEEFVNGQWVPYVDTLEFQLIMLDPYIRTFIKGDKDGVYTLTTKLPDHFGVYTFEASVHRPGYGNLVDFTRHGIAPLRHNAYERFVPAAYPYYAAAFSMIGGVFVLSIVFLFHQDPKRIL